MSAQQYYNQGPPPNQYGGPPPHGGGYPQYPQQVSPAELQCFLASLATARRASSKADQTTTTVLRWWRIRTARLSPPSWRWISASAVNALPSGRVAPCPTAAEEEEQQWLLEGVSRYAALLLHLRRGLRSLRRLLRAVLSNATRPRDLELEHRGSQLDRGRRNRGGKVTRRRWSGEYIRRRRPWGTNSALHL